MWIFMNDAFFSVVKDRNNADGVVVRARVEGDLENVFGSDKEVIVTDDSDYRFRLFLDQEYVKNVIADRVGNISYPNFKNSIKKTDHERKAYYTDVWGIMYDWQAKLYQNYTSFWHRT